jgi:peptidoglycan/xylan/chitin deacetylase (PgdA/CDA1 family)
MKQAGLRIDIDNITDATTGLAGLQKLLYEYNMRCTIFVNMGKSINHFILLKDIARTFQNVTGKTSSDAPKISVVRKLGKKGLFKTLLFNPPIGPLAKNLLLDMSKNGNELGLHGGRNHTTWQRLGDRMPKEKLLSEIKWGKDRFEQTFGFEPKGFASPGFKTTPQLSEILSSLKFLYHSDSCGDNKLTPENTKMPDVPVNVVGPQTVPIVEYLWSMGMDNDDITDRIISRFDAVAAAGIPVMYGHPSVEGNLLREVFSKVIAKLSSNGWTLSPLKDILNAA